MAFQTTTTGSTTNTFDPSEMLYWTNGSYFCGTAPTAVAAAADAALFDAGGGLHVNLGKIAVLQHAGSNPAIGNGATFENGASLSLSQAQYTAIKAAL